MTHFTYSEHAPPLFNSIWIFSRRDKCILFYSRAGAYSSREIESHYIIISRPTLSVQSIKHESRFWSSRSFDALARTWVDHLHPLLLTYIIYSCTWIHAYIHTTVASQSLLFLSKNTFHGFEWVFSIGLAVAMIVCLGSFQTRCVFRGSVQCYIVHIM